MSRKQKILSRIAFKFLLRCMPTNDSDLARACTYLATALQRDKYGSA